VKVPRGQRTRLGLFSSRFTGESIDMGNMRVGPEIIKAGMEKIEMKRRQTKSRKSAQRFFDYLVVIDFEATCFGRDNTKFCQEIIQFPAVLVDCETLTIKDAFCEFVKPVVNPTLTEYCTNLTGITQDMVEDGMMFARALQHFEEWLLSHELGTKYTFTIVTDGCYDMGRFLYKQCQLSGIKYPTYAHRWMNIRKAFCLFYHIRWYNIELAVEMLGEKFQGRPHNGSDDALNIAKVVIALLKDGGEAIENERILLNEEDQMKNATVIQNDRRIWFGLDTVENITRKDFLHLYRLDKRSNDKNNNDDDTAEDLSGSGSDDSSDSSGKENIDTEEDEGYGRDYPYFHQQQQQREFPAAYSDVAFGSHHAFCPVHGPTCYYGTGSRGGRCGSYQHPCRVSNQILGPHHYLPSTNIYHPKYPTLYPLSRRSNYPVNPQHGGSEGSTNNSSSNNNSNNVPLLSRAQRPPGMLRRAVEAAVAASENVH